MKVIEVLFPLFSNIYADLYNIDYLNKCNKNIKVVYTNYGEKPYFLNHKVDMIYIGSMPDSKILIAIDHLKTYKDKLIEMIENNVIFLVTGNALEIFSSYIIEDDKKEEGLHIFDYYIEKDLTKKNASWYFGMFNNIKIVGHRNQCSKCFNIKHKFINTKGGLGSDLADKSNEGIKYKNFYATYLLGPILIMNPKFTKHILGLLSLDKKLIYEKEVTNAYKKRIEYFTNPTARFVMGDHG